MKLAVIGANGKSGKLICYEAYKRGHEVTAILRDREKMPGIPYAVIEKDLFDLNADDLRPFDAVISAFGVPFGKDISGDIYQKAYAHLIGVFQALPETRLLVVGGAASLYLDETRTRRVLDTFPEAIRKDPEDLAKAYELLKNSGVKYTFFSPACFFDPRGKKTRTYETGLDTVIKNASGESYISYADYAVAMVDEAEQDNHIRQRFTAVSDSRPKLVEKPYYGLREKAPVFEGLSQFREPFNYELAGHHFRLVMDDGKGYSVEFLDGHTLRWAEMGGETTTEYYDCAKGEENVYFVNFEFVSKKPRTNITLVLDNEERLVTVCTTITGYHPKFPYMVDTAIAFGVVDIPGYPLPRKRHKYTAELLGKRIHWHYSPEIEIVHVYYATDYIRVTQPEGKGWEGADPDMWNELVEREPYDEPASYVKIREGLYLVSCMEKNMACRGWTGNSMIFLIDTKRVHDVGRSFGHAGMETGKVHPENYLFGAFGQFVYSDGKLEARPNVYREHQVW